MIVKFSGLLWPVHRFAHHGASGLPLYLITPGIVMSTAHTAEPTTSQSQSPQATAPPATNPATQTSPNAAHRLRTTMAAVKRAFTWLGVRKTLAPEQRTTEAQAFHTDRELLSPRRRQLGRGRHQVAVQAGVALGRAARSSFTDRRARGCHCVRLACDGTPSSTRRRPDRRVPWSRWMARARQPDVRDENRGR